MMNKKGHAGMVSHFAGMGGIKKQEWIMSQSIEDLEILLEGLARCQRTSTIWSKLIEALLKEKRAQLRDDKLNDLGII